MANSFKTCAVCGNGWDNLADLIRDEQVELIGYQPAFSDSYEGLFFFAHSSDECGTTIALPVSSFASLYEGPVQGAQLAGTQQCEGLCQAFYEFGACGQDCTMHWVRDIITIIVDRGPEQVLARLEHAEPQQRCA
jgi:hypothetical protein